MMRLSKLIETIPGCRIKGRADVEIYGIAFDSRMVRTGYLFAALPGARRDGHDYVSEARRRGAVAVLVQKDVSNSSRAAIVRVPDARAALARAADRFYGSPSAEIEVIGVTGTNGKTSVCYLTRQILEAARRRTALIGTVEYLIGTRTIPAERTTPESPHIQRMLREAVENGCDCMVMEVSSHALQQRRVDCVRFATAAFTNLGRDHLDFHGGMENYFNAKAALFRTPRLRRGVVNADDPWGVRLAGEAEVPMLTYGTAEGADIRALSIETGGDGSRFTMETPRGRVKASLPLLGAHSVSNALAAAGIALSMDIPLELVQSVLSRARTVPGRLEEIKSGQRFRVFIDYAHTEEALESALLALRAGNEGRIILVFGCGGDRDRSKRLPMGRVAARWADSSFITSDNPRGEDPMDIIEGIKKGFSGSGKKCVVIPDRREAIAAALAEAADGDTLLVAGKGHECMQEFAATIVPFSDRDVVAEILQSRAASTTCASRAKIWIP